MADHKNLENDKDGGCASRSIDIGDDSAGLRLDKFVAGQCDDLSRARVQGLIQDGHVRLDGQECTNTSQKLKAGSVVELTVPALREAEPEPEDIPLDIVYEDNDMLVINKQVGLVVHPGAGNWSGTLVNALLHHCGDTLSGIGGVIRPGIVHRLDKDTSGLMVVAKHDQAHQFLSAQLADRSLSRHYYALVWKVPAHKKGVVDASIGRHPSQRQKMAANARNGRNALTHYMVRERYHDAAALVECKLETGRTHQVRVHMAHIGHPLIGDPAYGLQDNAGEALLRKSGYDDGVFTSIIDFPRQALHAFKIGFIHPRAKKEMSFEIDFPEDMKVIKSILEQ